jgi:hypothetical protein
MITEFLKNPKTTVVAGLTLLLSSVPALAGTPLVKASDFTPDFECGGPTIQQYCLDKKTDLRVYGCHTTSGGELSVLVDCDKYACHGKFKYSSSGGTIEGPIEPFHP